MAASSIIEPKKMRGARALVVLTLVVVFLQAVSLFSPPGCSFTRGAAAEFDMAMGTWRYSYPDNATEGPSGVLIDTDSSNLASVAYWSYYSGQKTARASSAGAWTLEAGAVTTSGAAAFDNNMNPAVVYKNASGAVILARKSGGSWSNETVHDGGSGENAAGFLVAFDSQNSPHIAYMTVSSYAATYAALKYAHNTTNGWAVDVVAADIYNSPIAMAIDGADRPHISYCWHTPGYQNTLYAAYWDGSAWSNQTIATLGNIPPSGTSNSHACMAYGQNQLAVIYSGTDSYDALFAMSSYSGGSWGAWAASAVPSGANSVSVAFTSAGAPIVATITSGSSGGLKLWSKSSAGSWAAISTVQLGSPNYASLAIDSADNAHVAYSIATAIGSGSVYLLKVADWVPAPPSIPAAAPQTVNAAPYPQGSISPTGVNITWSAVLAKPSVSAYNIYRSTTQGSLGTSIGTASNTTLYYVDTTAAKDSTYYYQVRAVNSLGESANSSQSSSIFFENPMGSSLNVSVTPASFVEDQAADVTVTVTDAYGRPVAGATVLAFIANTPTNPSHTIANVTTDANGRASFSITPDISGSMDVYFRATKRTTTGYKNVPLAESNEMGRAFAFLSSPKTLVTIFVMPFAIVITGGAWGAIYYRKKRKFTEFKMLGFSEVVKDNPSAGIFDHIDGQYVLERWKKIVSSSKEAKAFISKGLLDSCRIKVAQKSYAGYLNGDEEVEYYSEDDYTQRIGVNFQLYTNPKPTPPDKYVNEVQVFPVSERVVTCGKCSGHGTIPCTNCKATGVVNCRTCKGSGTRQCPSCNGMGSKGGQESHTSGGVTTIRSVTYICKNCNGSGRIPCLSCNGSGKEPCSVCHGAGKITCPTCGGDKKVRELHRRIWKYAHEKPEQIHGVEGIIKPTKGFEPIRANTQDVPMNGLNDATTLKLDGKEADSALSINAVLERMKGTYMKWMDAARKVILRAYKLMVFPVMKCEVEYPTRKGPKTFKIWAMGNPRGWVLDAKETPTELTARIAALHAICALMILIELAIEAGIYLNYIKF